MYELLKQCSNWNRWIGKSDQKTTKRSRNFSLQIVPRNCRGIKYVEFRDRPDCSVQYNAVSNLFSGVRLSFGFIVRRAKDDRVVSWRNSVTHCHKHKDTFCLHPSCLNQSVSPLPLHFLCFFFSLSPFLNFLLKPDWEGNICSLFCWCNNKLWSAFDHLLNFQIHILRVK